MIKKFEEFISDLNQENIEEGKFKNIVMATSIAGSIMLGGNKLNSYMKNTPDFDKIEYSKTNTENIGLNYYPSDEILDYIKKAEGWHKGWQDDGKGYLTTGWGFKINKTLKKNYPKGMSKEQADKYFIEVAIPERVEQFKKCVPNIEKYNQNQLDALFDLFYNIGYGKFTKGSPSLQLALKKYDVDKIIQEMDHDYNNKKLPGAKIRRDFERQLFLQDC